MGIFPKQRRKIKKCLKPPPTVVNIKTWLMPNPQLVSHVARYSAGKMVNYRELAHHDQHSLENIYVGTIFNRLVE